jgi:hypothetical protein
MIIWKCVAKTGLLERQHYSAGSVYKFTKHERQKRIEKTKTSFFIADFAIISKAIENKEKIRPAKFL